MDAQANDKLIVRGLMVANPPQGTWLPIIQSAEQYDRFCMAFMTLRAQEQEEQVADDPEIERRRQDYVRQICQAIRSTEDAVDAFHPSKDKKAQRKNNKQEESDGDIEVDGEANGQLKPTVAMAIINTLSEFELQHISWEI